MDSIVAFQTVALRNLTNWSVRYLLDVSFDYKEDYDVFPIGDFLERSRNRITIQDEIEYKRITVRANNNGVVLRDIEIGKNIGTKRQYEASKGQFILSKIDARNGAIGLIPSELDDAVVTNDFPTFNIDTQKILPQFLVLITTTKHFLKFAQNHSSGTTNRRRIDLDLFLDVKIPLPSIKEQKRIVANYNIKIQFAEKQEAQAQELEENIERYLSEELGVKKTDEQEIRGLNFVAFRKTSRWDTKYFFREKSNLKSKFPLVNYGEIFAELKNGIASRNFSEQGIRYLKVSDIKFNSISNHNVFYVNECKEKDLLKKGTLLITRKGTVGQSYYLNENIDAVASSEIFTIQLSDKVLGEYIAEVNLASFMQKQYVQKNSGTIMPSLSQAGLKSIIVPLPPVAVQKSIIKQIAKLKDKIKTLRNQAQSNRKSAVVGFEGEIFTK